MSQLNELAVKAAMSSEKEYLLADGEGLFLRVRSSGKAWVYRYKQAGRQTKLSLGPYPAVSLATARAKARQESVNTLAVLRRTVRSRGFTIAGATASRQ